MRWVKYSLMVHIQFSFFFALVSGKFVFPIFDAVLGIHDSNPGKLSVNCGHKNAYNATH